MRNEMRKLARNIASDTSLIISFRDSCPCRSPPTDSNRLTPTDSDGSQKCRNAEMQKCRNAEMQKCRNAEMQKCRNKIDRASMDTLYIEPKHRYSSLLPLLSPLPHPPPMQKLRT